MIQGPKHLNVLTQASFKFLDLSLHAALNVKLILQVFSQDVTLTEPEMNQNAARALQRLLSFRLGSQGFPRPRAVSATGYRGLAGLTLPALLLPAAPPADPPEQTCTAWAAEAPEAVPRGLGRAGRRQHPAPGRPRAPEPLPRTGLRGCGKLGPGGPRGEVGGGEKAESSPRQW